MVLRFLRLRRNIATLVAIEFKEPFRAPIFLASESVLSNFGGRENPPLVHSDFCVSSSSPAAAATIVLSRRKS